MEFILASSNPHKAEEFTELIDKKILEVKPASEKIDVEETGQSYYENALLKAQSYYNKFKVPVLADDSGLNVLMLPSELGIYSARFGGDGLNDRDRAELLLKKLLDENIKDRSAFFTCVLCFYVSPAEIYYFEGRMNGVIAYNYRGNAGFGYDPVFIPNDYPNNTEDLTVAELGNWKNDHSHRAEAVKHAVKFFREK